MSSLGAASRDLVVVTPVWGERHIRRFLDLVLPSWLAPGNLPALAGHGKVPIVFVTRERDIQLITRSAPFRRALAFIEPEFIAMDDLIGPYGVPVTLTLAYTRGIAHKAEPGRRRPFALLNADFLLSDGSLRSLGEALDAGAKLILAPSLRVIEEKVVDDLMLGVEDETFVRSSRELVGRALRAPHPTLLCSRVDQTNFSSANPNQLFWRPTPDLLIGRAFCLFTLAAVVEGPVGQVGSYCDYGFTEDLGVTDEPVIFGDSDRFLAIELAPLRQEEQFFQYRPPSPAQVAEKLSVWTNQAHREQCRHVILYKAADPPDDLSETLRASDRFLEAVARHLGPPQTRLEHPHWLGGVAGWRVAREYRGVTVDPPELAPTVDIRVRPPGAALTPARGIARELLFGSPGRRWLQHPYWRLERVVRRRQRAMATRHVSILGASASNQLLDEASATSGPLEPRFADGAVAYIDLASAEGVEQLIAKLRGLAPDRPAILVVRRTAETDLGPMAIADLASALDTDFIAEALETFDLRLDRRVELTHGRFADMRAASPGEIARLAISSLVEAARLLLVNLLIASGLARAPNGALSAAVITCRRRPAAQ
jgi:hypothetical protein